MLTGGIGTLCKYVFLEYIDFYVNIKKKKLSIPWLYWQKDLLSLLLTKDSPPLDTDASSQNDTQTFAVFRDVARVHYRCHFWH